MLTFLVVTLLNQTVSCDGDKTKRCGSTNAASNLEAIVKLMGEYVPTIQVLGGEKREKEN